MTNTVFVYCVIYSSQRHILDINVASNFYKKKFRKQRTSQKIRTEHNAEINGSWGFQTLSTPELLPLLLRELERRSGVRLLESEYQDICCEIVFSRNCYINNTGTLAL